MIQSLELVNIRCFDRAGFQFGPKINLLLGPNGSGKTTVLEGVALFSYGRFPGAPQDFSAVASGKDMGRVAATGEQGDAAVEVEALISRSEKAFRIFSNKTPASQVIGLFRVVYFSPETIDLVAGSPQTRRRELDFVIAQTESGFAKVLLEYKNVLRQRNRLLRRIAQGGAKESELHFWDGRMVELSGAILARRKEFLGEISRSIASSHGRLTRGGSALCLDYLPSCDYERLDEVLTGALELDLRSGLTSFGPHRDDFSFKDGKVSLRERASRGEQRLAAVAYKMECRRYLEKDGSRAILILDDVFSELDASHREAVAKAISEDGQILISATDERVLPDGLREKANIIKIKSQKRHDI